MASRNVADRSGDDTPARLVSLGPRPESPPAHRQPGLHALGPDQQVGDPPGLPVRRVGRLAEQTGGVHDPRPPRAAGRAVERARGFLGEKAGCSPGQRGEGQQRLPRRRAAGVPVGVVGGHGQEDVVHQRTESVGGGGGSCVERCGRHVGNARPEVCARASDDRAVSGRADGVPASEGLRNPWAEATPIARRTVAGDPIAQVAVLRPTAGPGPPSKETHAPMTDTLTGTPALDAVTAALATVQDPEINRPLTELGMVKDVQIGADGAVRVDVYLTVAGCPMRETITNRVTTAVSAVPGVTSVQVELDVMSDEQRAELRKTVRGTDAADPVIPFAQPGSLTRVYAVASGKGGVGKSSVTVNLAAALAKRGLSVGVVDADIYGHSVPRMLGVEDKPTQVDNMIMPPQAYGVKVISIGMFTPGNTPVVWRGPMLHRALQQFLADVWWGDLDVLLMDLPPGTGDVAISVAQLVPNAEILVVTTPQLAAAEVAERAGAIATQTHQQVVGVVENMSWLELPDGNRMEIFGSGGGQAVSDALTKTLGARVPLLGQIPLDTRLREAGDAGAPIVLAEPDAPAARSLAAIADSLAVRQRGLSGMSLGLTPVRR